MRSLSQDIFNGLIPACAGKTFSLCLFRIDRGAHPRVCGENLHLVTVDEAWAGSSPRVRGKPVESVSEVLDAGLIPACAGKT